MNQRRGGRLKGRKRKIKDKCLKSLIIKRASESVTVKHKS